MALSLETDMLVRVRDEPWISDVSPMTTDIFHSYGSLQKACLSWDGFQGNVRTLGLVASLQIM